MEKDARERRTKKAARIDDTGAVAREWRHNGRRCRAERSTRCYEETLERTNGGAPRCDANRGKVSEGERWSGDAPRCDAGDSKVRFGG